jgi:hypothetical protein
MSAFDIQGYFEGSLSHLYLYNSALDMYAVDCMYQDLEATAGRCSSDPTEGETERDF